MVDLFKGIKRFTTKKNIAAPKEKTVHKNILPVLNAEELLNTEKRQQNIEEVRSLLNLPENEYDHFFYGTLKNIAEFYQNLPETERSYYSNLGGMLDHALERASLSLFLCRTYLLPQEATLASISEEEMIWVYAVYTAALLYDVGKIATQHIITLTDEEGNTLKNWSPYTGPMTAHAPASHYVCGFSEDHHDHMRWMVTPLLARQVLPEEGFHLIASDNEVLESWLALLSDEHRQVGSLLTTIPLADAQLMEGFFTDRKVFRHNLSPQTIALLSRLQRQRDTMRRQKDLLKEKMLGEQADKSIESLGEKESFSQTSNSNNENKKSTKQSLFGIASSVNQINTDKKNTSKFQQGTIEKYDAKNITKQFLDWVQKAVESKNITANQSDSLVQRIEKGVVVNEKLLKVFLEENKIKQLPLENFKEMLTQLEIGKPVNYTNTVMLAQQTGQFSPAVLINNPYLVFPSGLPPIAAASIGVQLITPTQVQELVKNTPAVETVQAPRIVPATSTPTFSLGKK